MSGHSIRFKLWLKLWATSLPAILLMLLVPIAAVVIYLFLSPRMTAITSVFYEKTALLLFIFIMQWCFSIDFDSKFYNQLMTYPIARWRLIAERVWLSLFLFISLLIIVTIGLTPLFGGYVWKALLFSLPIYVAMGGIVALAAVIGKHSLGGLFAGLVIWLLSLNIGTLWKRGSPVLLDEHSVYDILSGGSGGIWAGPHDWILYNRVFYLGVGVFLLLLAIRYVSRKTDGAY